MRTTATHITVQVPLAIRRRSGRKTVVIPSVEDGPAAVTSRADPALVKALARAFRYQRLLDDERYASISEMAAAERIDRGYLGRILQLKLLSPDIVEAILDVRQPLELGRPAMIEPLPAGWARQRAAVLRGASSKTGTRVAAKGEPAPMAAPRGEQIIARRPRPGVGRLESAGISE